jgi:YidC/Oxa1 family membrane protein insertase
MSFSDLIYPFEWIVSWILWGWHSVFTTLGIPSDSGVAWTLSIVGLVVVMRAAMIPLFVKQIHASRRMQLIQPEMQKIQAKYKDKKDRGSRQAMTQETMDLYKRTGTNPFSSCLPILLQSPFFFGLFRVLNGLKKIADGSTNPIGPITRKLAGEAESSTFFGAQLSDKFIGASSVTVQIVTVLLIVLMSASTFTTQRQLMMKNMPASALDNPFAKQQKMLLYLMPIFFAISGVNFPIGVLLYWLTTNVWSMCQQFYVIRKMPAPGSLAEKAMQERRRKKGKPIEEFTVKGLDKTDATDTEAPKAGGQRVQPSRNKKKKGAAAGQAKKSATASTTDTKPQTDN